MSITSYPPAACSIHSIDHFALTVPDLEVAHRFFDAFGLIVERSDRKLHLRTSHSHHVWGSVLPGGGKQLAYLSFNCRAGELERINGQVLDAGGRQMKPPPSALHPDGFWFRDPEGNLIQVRVGPKTTPDFRSTGQAPPRANRDRGVLSRSAARKVHPTRLSHVLLYTTDVERQIGFYTRSIGLGLSDKS
jgi:catechol 2,3-dioxygenase-like lactoylglutathione lyase family enzyme